MTELQSCVVLVALLLLSQSCIVFVMLLFSYGLRRTARKFLVDDHENINKTLWILGKSVSDVLKVEERFRDMLLHMKVFANGLMPLRMDRKRQTMPLTVEPRHWWLITPHGTSEIFPWAYAQYFMHGNCYRSWNLSSKCLPYRHQQPGEMKSLCTVDSTCVQQWPKSHAHSTYQSSALEKWRQCIPQSHFNSWQVMDAFDHQLKWQNADWHASVSSSMKIAWRSRQDALKVMHVLFFSQNGLVLYHLMLIGMTVCGKYYCTLLQDKVRQHNLTAVQISPHVITGCLHVWKNIFEVNIVNQKMISTLLSLTLCIVWARINTKLQLIVYHVNGKSVWTVLFITFSRGHMCQY